jgi:hypothetical protein
VVASHDVVVYEYLQVKNLVKHHHLAKSIHDAGWLVSIHCVAGRLRQGVGQGRGHFPWQHGLAGCQTKMTGAVWRHTWRFTVGW